MRCALLLSLIAAARAFAPPSILRASVVVKNEADAASTAPESHGRISIARRVVMPRALRRASKLSLRTQTPRRRHSIACNACLRHPPPTEIGTSRNTPTQTRTHTAANRLHKSHTPRPPHNTATIRHAGGFRYDNSDSVSPLEKKKALQDTASWCLERCIKLGHCEVFEDLNKMSTAQVQDFCKACVLTGEATQDECDVSMMFIEDGPWASIDRAAVGV